MFRTQGTIRAQQLTVARSGPAHKMFGFTLRATKGSVVEQSTIFTGEWHTLRRTLIDDIDGNFRQGEWTVGIHVNGSRHP